MLRLGLAICLVATAIGFTWPPDIDDTDPPPTTLRAPLDPNAPDFTWPPTIDDTDPPVTDRDGNTFPPGSGGGSFWGNLVGGLFNRPTENVIDRIHEYRFVEHKTDTAHVLIAIHDDRSRDERTCFLIVVDQQWEGRLLDRTQEQNIIEDVYKVIHDPASRTNEIHSDDFVRDYDDVEGARECRGHNKYLVHYAPPGAGAQGGNTLQPPSTTFRSRPIG